MLLATPQDVRAKDYEDWPAGNKTGIASQLSRDHHLSAPRGRSRGDQVTSTCVLHRLFTILMDNYPRLELTAMAEASLIRPVAGEPFPAVARSTGREHLWISRRVHNGPDRETPLTAARIPQSRLLSFNITPYLGINNVRYGMLRREVRQALGQATSAIRRQAQGPAEDVYGERHAFFQYDQSDRLQGVEFTTAADLSIGYYRVSGLTFAELEEQILEWDPSARTGNGEVKSTTLGLTVRHDRAADAYASIITHPDPAFIEPICSTPQPRRSV
jgi:hypothetical protein